MRSKPSLRAKSPLPEVVVFPAVVSRATGWALKCSVCGPLVDDFGEPTSVPTKLGARVAGARHLEGKHFGRGVLKVIDRHVSRKARARGRRKARRLEELAPSDLAEKLESVLRAG